MIMKKCIISILAIFILVACQPQTPRLVLSATATDRPTVVPATVTPTSTPAETSTLLEEEPGPFEFESIKMFDENGTGEIKERSGWAVAILPDGYEYVLHTDDGGQTWNRPALTWGSYNSSRAPIFLSSQVAWNTNPDGILEQTLDGGRTWIPRWDVSRNPALVEGEIVSLYFWDAENGMAVSGTVGAGTAFIVLSETHDGGESLTPLTLTPPWESASSDNGSLQLCNHCMDRIYFDSSRITIVSGLSPNQILQSEIHVTVSLDDGKTWNYGKVVIPEGLQSRQARYGDMKFFDDQQGVFSIWATDQKSFDFYNEHSAMFPFYTEDGGLTWTLKTPTPTGDISDQYVGFETFFSPIAAVVRCGNKLCVTQDGAQSWTLIQPDINFPASPDAVEWLVDLDFVNPTMGFVLLSPSSGVTDLYRTSDGGMHWTQIEYQLTE